MPKLFKAHTDIGLDVVLEIVEKTRDTVLFKDIKTGELYRVKIKKTGKDKYIIDVNGVEHVVYSKREEGVFIDFAVPLITELTSEIIHEKKEVEKRIEKIQPIELNTLYSPISGRILEIKVQQGMKINSGDIALLMESMKMVIEVKSHLTGIVEEVYVQPHMSVKKGDKLLKIKPL